MKNVVKLTADELATVLDTIETTAIVQTLKETSDADVTKTINSINWPSVFSALFESFDNGLTAMGIEIAEDAEAMEEEEEDEEEEEYTPCDDCYHPYACEMCEYADDDDDDNDDDEEEADPIEEMLFIYDGKVTISEKNAMEITHQMAEMIEERGEGLTAAQKTVWLHDALTALAKDYGIEYVLNI